MDIDLTSPSRCAHSHPDSMAERFPWHGIRTKSNQERVVATALLGKGYQPYLPLHFRRRGRADVCIDSGRPLFPGYIFCRFDAKKRLPILMTAGVVSVLSVGREPVAIADAEIEGVKVVVRSGLASEVWPYLCEGQRVRVTNGSLEGLEGILIKKNTQFRMVVSITMLQRSLSVEIDRDSLAPI